MAIKLCILDARLILNYFHHNYSLPKISACIARHIQSQSLIGTWISFHIKKKYQSIIYVSHMSCCTPHNYRGAISARR